MKFDWRIGILDGFGVLHVVFNNFKLHVMFLETLMYSLMRVEFVLVF